MLIFRQLFDSETSTYTYVLGDSVSKEAVVVDPVKEKVDRDLDILNRLGLRLKYGMNTHVHADHVTGTGLLKQKLNNSAVKSVLGENSGGKADVYVKDGSVLKFGELQLECRSTPGHTNGCVSYVLHSAKMVFTGDTLLIGGCGRTDFQQGNSSMLYDMVHTKLFTLPDEYAVYPAHDYTGEFVSSIGEEKRYNKRLTKSKEEFVRIMENLKLPKPKHIDIAVPSNLVCGLQDAADSSAAFNGKNEVVLNLSKKPDELVEVKPATRVFLILGKLALAITLGFVFGWAMEKSKVYEPMTIKQQMIFTKFIMLKMFLAALATSTLSILVLSLLFKKVYEEVFQSYCDSLKNKSAFIIILGATLLGIGMQVSGACPGMVLVQLGAGVPWSYITFVGALVGALLHGLLNSYIMKSVKPDTVLSKTLAQVLCNIHAAIPRSVFTVLLAVVIFLLEYFIPWTKEYPNVVLDGSSNFMIYKAWPPAACGVLLGLLQFFTILFLRRSLGTSSSYSTLVGVPFFTKSAQEKFPYLAKFRIGLQNWLTVIFVCSAILGGFVSSYTAGVFGTSVGTHPYNAFFGGLFMVFGARVAGGCTSGHGISGSSHQFLGSFLAVIFMFAGGIFMGFYNFFS